MSRRKVQFLFNKFFEKREKFGIFCFLFGFFNGVFWIASLLGCVVRQSGLWEGYQFDVGGDKSFFVFFWFCVYGGGQKMDRVQGFVEKGNASEKLFA